MPAIHKAYAEVCQQFPALAAEDVAQQAALVLLEAARAPAMRNQNGYLPIALARDFHKRLIRWAFGEIRQSVPSEEVSTVYPEPQSDENFERDRKSTRLNSSHRTISYAVFCLKKKKK